MRFPEFKNKKVLVMGLGFHGGGVGATKFFSRQGAKVLVTDLKSRKELFESIHALKNYTVRYVLGRHRKSDFRNADYVFKGPDVPQSSPYLVFARRHGIPILERAGLFLENCPARVIGITGTKGKSTTATLLARILKKKYKKVWLLGTPGTSILEALPKIKKDDIVVAEFSSFELEDLHKTKESPAIAIITSIFPDHLNRHKSFENYVYAKSAIFRYQEPEDYLVVPHQSPWLSMVNRQEIPGRLTKVRTASWARILPEGDWTKEDYQNVVLAFETAKIMGATTQMMREAVKTLRRLPGRREVVRSIKGVTFINDTTATNPPAALSAIRHYTQGKNLVVIAGGFDKGLDYREFSRALEIHARCIVFLPGSATEKIKRLLSWRIKNRMREVFSMKEAVHVAWRAAKSGDIVLLSPGAASFGLFKHEFDRGEQFARIVRTLRS